MKNEIKNKAAEFNPNIDIFARHSLNKPTEWKSIQESVEMKLSDTNYKVCNKTCEVI